MLCQVTRSHDYVITSYLFYERGNEIQVGLIYVIYLPLFLEYVLSILCSRGYPWIEARLLPRANSLFP